jgi:hypothetical protein
MQFPRFGLGAVVATNGKIYAVGGSGGASVLDTVEEATLVSRLFLPLVQRG